MNGFTHPHFTALGPALAGQIAKHGGGAALTVMHRGRVVADLWGGVRDEAGTPWTRDTLALSFSTGKGVAATLVHALVSQGKLAYDAPVARYWPAFAEAGKHAITVRHLLAHQAGLWPIRDLLDDASAMRDWPGMLRRLERARPLHAPDGRSGYHALTFGWLVGGLVEHVTGKPFAVALADEVAGPLGLDGCYTGLPPSEHARRARLLNLRSAGPRRGPRLATRVMRGAYRAARLLTGNDPKAFQRALLPRGIRDFDWNAPETVEACMPSAAGMFTSRALAKVYAMLAEGGALDGVRIVAPEVLHQATRIQHQRPDDVLWLPMHWRLGYHRVLAAPKSAFGHFGLGGSGAWCDPSRRLAVALTLNSGVGTPIADLRILRLNRLILRILERGHADRAP